MRLLRVVMFSQNKCLLKLAISCVKIQGGRGQLCRRPWGPIEKIYIKTNQPTRIDLRFEPTSLGLHSEFHQLFFLEINLFWRYRWALRDHSREHEEVGQMDLHHICCLCLLKVSETKASFLKLANLFMPYCWLIHWLCTGLFCLLNKNRMSLKQYTSHEIKILQTVLPNYGKAAPKIKAMVLK